MILPVLIIKACILFLVFACNGKNSNPSHGDQHGYSESDAVRNWGAQMLDDQTTYYQDLFLKLTKLANTGDLQEADSIRIKFWLEGSSLESEQVRDRVIAHYCTFRKNEQSSNCEYLGMNLGPLSSGDENGQTGLEGFFKIPASERRVDEEYLKVRVSYCEVTCATTFLEFLPVGEEVQNSNREPLGGDQNKNVEDGTIITH